jgi:DNA polymerase IV
MDACIENVFPAVAMPFHPFQESTREEKGPGAGAPRRRAIPSIVHVDVDAFFASVEQVLNPKLRGSPVLVGRGVVASASYEAKMSGVKTAMTLEEALRICPQAVVAPGQYECYADFAERMRRILETYAPAVESAALDDFYLDFTGTERLYSDHEAVLQRMQTEILEQTRLGVSIGAARTKAVASIASRRDGPRGFRVIEPGAEDEFLAPLSVEELHGIEPVHAGMLAERGILTIGELRLVPRAALERAFGEAMGGQIWARARGLDGREVMIPSTPKSVLRETTIKGGTTDAEFLGGLIQYLSERIASTLQGDGRRARTMGLGIVYVDQFTAHQTARLARPSNVSGELLAKAKEFFAELFTRRVAVRSVNVRVTNLEDPQQQGALDGCELALAGAQRFEAPGKHAALLQRTA